MTSKQATQWWKRKQDQVALCEHQMEIKVNQLTSRGNDWKHLYQNLVRTSQNPTRTQLWAMCVSLSCSQSPIWTIVTLVFEERNEIHNCCSPFKKATGELLCVLSECRVCCGFELYEPQQRCLFLAPLMILTLLCDTNCTFAYRDKPLFCCFFSVYSFSVSRF